MDRVERKEVLVEDGDEKFKPIEEKTQKSDVFDLPVDGVLDGGGFSAQWIDRSTEENMAGGLVGVRRRWPMGVKRRWLKSVKEEMAGADKEEVADQRVLANERERERSKEEPRRRTIVAERGWREKLMTLGSVKY